RYRSFRGDPADTADEELVEHHVPDDQDAGGGECAGDAFGAGTVRRDERRRAHGRSVRSAAKGSVIITRKSIRNSESPKLCSKSPAASMPAMAASPPAARNRCRLVFSFFQRSVAATTRNQIQIASAGRPRSAAIWIGTLCRCGFTFSTA